MILLHLFKRDVNNSKEEVITLKDLIKYFKRKQAIKINSSGIIYDRLDYLFDKYRYLFKNIKLTNEAQFIKDIHKWILVYNKKLNDRSFTKQFYEQLLLIACKNDMLTDVISFIVKK